MRFLYCWLFHRFDLRVRFVHPDIRFLWCDGCADFRQGDVGAGVARMDRLERLVYRADGRASRRFYWMMRRRDFERGWRLYLEAERLRDKLAGARGLGR